MPSITAQPAIESNGNATNGLPHPRLDARRLGLDPNLRTTYPTQSLHFLRTLEEQKLTQNGGTIAVQAISQAKLKMEVVIVGAGLGGLATAIALARRGHLVTILEQAPALGEVGAGIQIPPNTGRLLRRWGVFDKLEKFAVRPDHINFRRWENGAVIGLTRLVPDFEENFGAPYYVAHRAHLHTALSERALELGVTVRLNSLVTKYSIDSGSVFLADGTVVKGDLVVGADGIKSLARETLHPETTAEPTFTGFAAYRATVDVEKMKADPTLAALLETPSLNVWIGEERHVMTYTIAAGKSFNMVLSHIDHSDPASWSSEGVVEGILQEFSGWDSQLLRIISLIETAMKWSLRSGSRLSSWVDPSSRLVLIGDAAHAMVPYMSQGAAMAMEDGAALAYVLSQISSLSELPFAMRTFEQERIKRSGAMQEASMVNGLIWHFPDGPEQAARDAAMRAEVEGRPFTRSANQWSDPVTQAWAYGYDAEDAMQAEWEKAVAAHVVESSSSQAAR
ncbi:FAD/NAD(P)-binding domain-containing protein [Thozetella sp. PMI_491]|nr:FAD/NAD(P)-binding domain-containing protein [Thozetella sp. PMI_491]